MMTQQQIEDLKRQVSKKWDSMEYHSTEWFAYCTEVVMPLVEKYGALYGVYSA